MKIDLKRTLDNQQQELLLQQLFTGSHVPENLVGMVRSFQEACIAQGIEDKLHFKESMVKRCEIQIGTLHLASSSLDEEKANKLAEQIAKEEGKASGQLDWKFTGINQFGSVTIRVHERSWQVEFSRLQRRISAFITDEVALKPKAHQALYEEMKRTLQPLASSELAQMLIFQGAPGLGKSHCTEHYFYHEANKHHQMVAWLSGESKEAFLKDWEALANQLRVIDAKRKNDSDTILIRHWCEEQLGQWLFIVDDLQVEIDWLKEYLPQKGGHVLITTAQPSYNLPKSAKILSFSPLSGEDSLLLLKAWLGKYWEAAGYAKEAQALSYFSEALGGSPALLTQIALLVRKKGLSFERAMGQFQDAKTRSFLLTDTVFDQLTGQTFLDCAEKSWRQWVLALGKHYPQFTYQQHEAYLKQFVEFLKQQVAEELEELPQVYVDEELIIAYWQGVWASLSCVPLDEEQIAACLNLLPLSYDKANQRWIVSLAGLHALVCQDSEKDLSTALSEITAVSLDHKEKPDLPQIPSGINLSLDLENAALGSVEIALLTSGTPAEFTAWRLPTANPYFIPRSALTAEIAEKLPFKTIHQQSAELVLAAASGIGGIGKTELARHFITEPSLSSKYQRRFWLNAGSTATLKNEFYDLADYLGLIEPKKYIEDEALIHCLHNWFKHNPGWLMVLDNADEYNNSIARWVPREGGSVLITTREPTPGTLRDEQIVRVPLLTTEEAVSWLYRLAQRDENAATEAEQQAVKLLVDNLGCLPLAIAQSAAYLREQKAVSIEAYQQNFLELLLKDESLIEPDKPIDKRSDVYSRRVIASTWKLSLERIEASAKEKGLFNACPWLLAVCSYLAPKDIPVGLLEYWFERAFKLEDISSTLLSYFLDEYIAQLLRYSLCERTGLTSMISMHRLVQEVLQSILIKELALLIEQEKQPTEIKYIDEQKNIVKEKIFSSLSTVLINYAIEFTPSIEDRRRRFEVISHLQKIIATWETLNHQGEIHPDPLILLYDRLAAIQLYLRADAKEGFVLYQKQLDLVQKQCDPEPLKVATVLANLGNAYGALGDAKQRKLLLERALPILEQHYGPEHLDVAGVLENLGHAYGELGDAQQKKMFVEKALRIKERHYDPQHRHMAITLANLGDAYGALGDAKQQKILLERALCIQECYYDPEHPALANTLNNLSNAYYALGEHQQQKCLLEKALHIKEHYYGSDHPEVAITLLDLSTAYGALGDAKQQKILLEKALPIFEQHYGPEHHTLAKTLLNLGSVYGDLGDVKQKKILLEKALHINEHYYGPEHPEVAKTLVNLGNVYGELGDAQQQKRLLERALRISEPYYGAEHPEVASVLINLGNAYGELGNAQQKKSLLTRALSILENHRGPEHYLESALVNLGNAYGELGDAQQKKNLLTKALSILENHYGPEHPRVARTFASLGDAYGDLGDAKQKEILLKRALLILERYYGSEHYEVANVLASLGNAYGALGDAQQQKQLLERALRINEHYFGSEHPKAALMLLDLGIAYGACGDAQQQKNLLERALSILENYYGPRHPQVARTLVNLGNAYGDLGNAQQQKNLVERALSVFEHHYGSEHPYLVAPLVSLGNAYGALGDAQQQKILLEKALRIAECHRGPEHIEVARILVDLGTAYGNLGNVQQQKNLLERALPIFEHQYGPEHPETALPLLNLGNAYGALGHIQQQKNILEKVLPIFEHHYGSEHPKVAMALIGLGTVYGVLGDVQRKIALLARALSIFKHHYGPEHPEVAVILTNLGNANGAMGNVQQQKSLLIEALTINERYYDSKHPKIAPILLNLSLAYGACGDAQQQKNLSERALPIFEQHYGFEHPLVASTLMSLGLAYGTLGNTQQKKILFERALHIREHYYGPEHPEVVIALIKLGMAYSELGDVQQKKVSLDRAWSILEKRYSPDYPNAEIILAELANAYGTLGDVRQKNMLLTRALLIKKHHSTPNSSVSIHYKQIGDSLLSYERPLEAISYYEKALGINSKFPGIHHNLACCYHAEGYIEKADACFQIGVALFPTPGILAEYAHFLIKQKRFQEALSFIEQCLEQVKDGRLSYGIAEYPTVLPAIQDLIDKHPSHSANLSAQGLAHYLQVFCYQECQQQEQVQEAIKRFELWIAQQTDIQQQETFQALKNSLVFETESIALNLLPPEQQFFSAVIAGDLNVVKGIIEKQNCSIDCQEKDSQRTALHLASISQQRDVIAYLLSKLARFDIKDKEGKLAWEYVINTPLVELFKTTSILFAQKYASAVNVGIFIDWERMLRMAVASDYLADVRFLIEVKGIDINSVDTNPKTRYTALHLAVIRNKPEIVKYLISKGADIHVLDANKKTPLDYIASEQKELLARFPLSASEMSAEECGLGFEKLSLQI